MYFFLSFQQKFCSFYGKNFYSFLIWCLSGFCFWSSFFSLHTSELPKIISSFSLQCQLYADDSYIFTTFLNYDLSFTSSDIFARLEKIISWSDSVFQIPSNSTYTKSAFSYCGPLMELSSSDLTSTILHLVLVKLLKLLFKNFVAEGF